MTTDAYILKCPKSMPPLREAMATPNHSEQEAMKTLELIWGDKNTIPPMTKEERARICSMEIPRRKAAPKATHEIIEKDGKTFFRSDGKEYSATIRPIETNVRAYMQGIHPYHLKDVGRPTRIVELGGESEEPCPLTAFMERTQLSTEATRLQQEGLTEKDVKEATDMLLHTIQKLKEHRATSSNEPIEFFEEELIASEAWMEFVPGTLEIDRHEDGFVSSTQTAAEPYIRELHPVLGCSLPPPYYMRKLKAEIDKQTEFRDREIRHMGREYPSVRGYQLKIDELTKELNHAQALLDYVALG